MAMASTSQLHKGMKDSKGHRRGPAVSSLRKELRSKGRLVMEEVAHGRVVDGGNPSPNSWGKVGMEGLGNMDLKRDTSTGDVGQALQRAHHKGNNSSRRTPEKCDLLTSVTDAPGIWEPPSGFILNAPKKYALPEAPEKCDLPTSLSNAPGIWEVPSGLIVDAPRKYVLPEGLGNMDSKCGNFTGDLPSSLTSAPGTWESPSGLILNAPKKYALPEAATAVPPVPPKPEMLPEPRFLQKVTPGGASAPNLEIAAYEYREEDMEGITAQIRALAFECGRTFAALERIKALTAGSLCTLAGDGAQARVPLSMLGYDPELPVRKRVPQYFLAGSDSKLFP